MTDYPLRWRHVSRGGYGYVTMVPCRLVRRGRARWTIAALLEGGGERVRSVRPENVIDPRAGASSPGASAREENGA